MGNNPLRFFIIEKDIFIAGDMRSGLQNACSDCEVHDVRHVDELAAKLGELPAEQLQPIFITNLNLDGIDSTGLAAIADSMRGAVVVREGSDPPDVLHGRGYHVLPAPFSWESLSELVGRLSAALSPNGPPMGTAR